MLIKTTHFLYIHHEHSSIPISNKAVYSNYHPKCPICAYETIDEIEIQNIFTLVKPEFIFSLLLINNYVIAHIHPLYTFNLRAPPVNDFFLKYIINRLEMKSQP
jgi:hypothetical protein